MPIIRGHDMAGRVKARRGSKRGGWGITFPKRTL